MSKIKRNTLAKQPDALFARVVSIGISDSFVRRSPVGFRFPTRQVENCRRLRVSARRADCRITDTTKEWIQQRMMGQET